MDSYEEHVIELPSLLNREEKPICDFFYRFNITFLLSWCKSKRWRHPRTSKAVKIKRFPFLGLICTYSHIPIYVNCQSVIFRHNLQQSCTPLTVAGYNIDISFNAKYKNDIACWKKCISKPSGRKTLSAFLAIRLCFTYFTFFSAPLLLRRAY